MKPKTTQRKHKTTTRKKKDNTLLLRKIYRYENNFSEAITSVYEDSDRMLLPTLLYVALYPQLKNHINIHHYKDFHLLIQNDPEFRAQVYANEKPETYMENNVLHYDLVPMLHHQLMDAVREMIVSGAGRKYHNAISKIADAIYPKGDELCDHR